MLVEVEKPMIGDLVTIKTWALPKTHVRYQALTYPDRVFPVAEIYDNEVLVAKWIGPDFPPVRVKVAKKYIDKVYRSMR